MLKNKRVDDIKNKIQIQMAKLHSDIASKKYFRSYKVQTFKKKYNARLNDLTLQFENIIKSDIDIEKTTQALNYLKLLYNNSELLVGNKPLPDFIQTALEFCFNFAIINMKKDLHNLLSELTKTNRFYKSKTVTTETKVHFNCDQVTIEDAKRFYPAIKMECSLQEDQYLANALSKYRCIFQSNDAEFNNDQNSSMSSFQTNSTLSTQNMSQYLPLYEMNSTHFTENTSQQIQFSQQNIAQQNQFIPTNMSQQNQLSTYDLYNTPQYASQHYSQPPQFTPQDLSQPPQYTYQSSTEISQFVPCNLSQFPNNTPENFTENYPNIEQYNNSNSSEPIQYPNFSIPGVLDENQSSSAKSNVEFEEEEEANL